MSMQSVIERAQEYMAGADADGWLVYDYRGLNPIFAETVGAVGALSHVTRPVWLWIPARGEARMLASFVDQSRFTHLGLPIDLFVNRADMVEKVRRLIGGASRVAMEYVPNGALPRVSKVDGGTLEMVRSLGVEPVSSADLLQYATQRWSADNLASHKFAAEKLTLIVGEAFDYIGNNIAAGVTEFDVAEFIRNRFLEEGMIVTDGPAVAVNEHASDPHFDPTPETSVQIRRGDWVLIDLWTRLPDDHAMFGDITWTAHVGEDVSPKRQEVFDIVTGARDAALAAIQTAFDEGRRPPARLGSGQSGARLHRIRRLRRLLQPPTRTQPGARSPLQRREPGFVGDIRHARADTRHSRNDRARHLHSRIRSPLRDRRLHIRKRACSHHPAPARDSPDTGVADSFRRILWDFHIAQAAKISPNAILTHQMQG